MSLEKKLGESLIRTLISDLDQRVAACEQLTPRLARYRLRWIRKDFTKLRALARRYGFKVV